jgi:hypothetical protein
VRRNRGPVWIIDAEHWPRASLRAELIERGHEAIGFATILDALTRLALRRQPPALAVIDLGGRPSNSKQLDALLRAGFPVLAIGGAAEWATESLRARPWAAFLRRPLTVGAIADEVERIGSL